MIRFLKKSLFSKLILFILLGTGFILVGVGGYGYFSSRSILREELITRVEGIADLAADRIDRVTLVAETVTKDVAMSLPFYDASQERFFPLLESIVSTHESVAGICVAFPQESKDVPRFAPFVYKDSKGLHAKDLGEEGYNLSSRIWYRVPVGLKAPVWTEPYFGSGGSERFIITYGFPSYDLEGRLLAVVVCDLSLDWLADFMDSLDIPGGGKGFVVGSDGSFLSHEDRSFLKGESLWSLAEKRNSQELSELGKRMVGGGDGILPVHDWGEDGWIVYRPIGDLGWSVGIFFPKTAITGPINDLLLSQVSLAFIGMILLLLVAWAISKAITGPIKSLSSATETLASGDFYFPLPVISGEDEIAQLAWSFSSMRQSLLAYVEELQDTTAARERMESELSIARSIQMSLVPRTFPPFPDRDDLDLFAVLDPAREVSGDFYDFLMLDDHRILIAVGDVSGKGVPAALFMAVTRTFIRAFAKEGLGPGAILSRLNDEISGDNDSCMFVTVFCAVVDLEDRSIRYGSGGHPPPLLVNGRSTRLLPTVTGPLVGIMPEMTFQEGEDRLELGEIIFIYTDGLTEAQDISGEFLGENLPVEWLKESEGLSSEQVVRFVGQRLKDFVGEASQYDDITMLALGIDRTTKS